jgi:hypothetical protein
MLGKAYEKYGDASSTRLMTRFRRRGACSMFFAGVIPYPDYLLNDFMAPTASLTVPWKAHG